jgi:hypothetical protein
MVPCDTTPRVMCHQLFGFAEHGTFAKENRISRPFERPRCRNRLETKRRMIEELDAGGARIREHGTDDAVGSATVGARHVNMLPRV